IFLKNDSEAKSPEIPSASPTPYPSPAIPTNMVTASNRKPPPPTAEQIKQQRWSGERSRLFDATYPLIDKTIVDVDDEHRHDEHLYRIQPWQDDFEGLLKITSANGRVLWEHEFYMGANDLAEFLTGVLGYDSVSDWVGNVFNKDQNYSFRAETVKIKA